MIKNQILNLKKKKILTHTHREFAFSIPRPFTVHYNPYTSNIEIIDSKTQLEHLGRDIESEFYFEKWNEI